MYSELILTSFKFIGLLAIFQTLLTFLIFVNRSGKDFKLLSSLFLTLSIILIGHFIGSSENLQEYLVLSIISHQFLYLIAPIFYLYVYAITQNELPDSSLFYIINFLPFGIILSLVTLVLIYFDIWYYYYTFSFFSNGLLCFYLPVYLWLINKQLKKENISIASLLSLSSIKDGNKFFWTLNIGFGMVLLYSLKIITLISWDFVKASQLCIDLSTLTMVSFFLLTTSSIYLGLSQSNLFLSRRKYESATIHSVDKNRLLSRILDYIEEDKPFLNSQFNLNMLSGDLNIPSRYISQILNQEYGCNFRELTNKYRIREAKSLIDNKNNYNLYQIALDVGYNSKSTFNSAFKRNIGITPTEYKNRTK